MSDTINFDEADPEARFRHEHPPDEEEPDDGPPSISDAMLDRWIAVAAQASQHGWSYGPSGPPDQSADEARAYMTYAYNLGTPGPVHTVWFGDGESSLYVAITGNGPTSEANAKHIAWSSGPNVTKALTELRDARARIAALEARVAARQVAEKHFADAVEEPWWVCDCGHTFGEHNGDDCDKCSCCDPRRCNADPDVDLRASTNEVAARILDGDSRPTQIAICVDGARCVYVPKWHLRAARARVASLESEVDHQRTFAVRVRDERIAELETDVASKQRGYDDLHAMLPGRMDIWTKLDALIKRIASMETEAAAYQDATCDHRHPCRCGSGGHPRRCLRHPLAFGMHCRELGYAAKQEEKWIARKERVVALEAALVQAVEVCGHFPTTPKADALIDGWRNLLARPEIDPVPQADPLIARLVNAAHRAGAAEHVEGLDAEAARAEMMAADIALRAALGLSPSPDNQDAEVPPKMTDADALRARGFTAWEVREKDPLSLRDCEEMVTLHHRCGATVTVSFDMSGRTSLEALLRQAVEQMVCKTCEASDPADEPPGQGRYLRGDGSATSRLDDDDPAEPVADASPRHDDSDPAELAYWTFDAHRAGRNRGPYLTGSPMAERDAFKAQVNPFVRRAADLRDGLDFAIRIAESAIGVIADGHMDVDNETPQVRRDLRRLRALAHPEDQGEST